MVQAGRRIDAPNTKTIRFPLSNVAMVRRRIAEVFDRAKPIALVSAAACGSDLLALEIAGERRIKRVVLLPAPPEKFRNVSVVDRPGDWGQVFDRLIGEVNVQVVSAAEGQSSYFETNLKLLDKAELLAAEDKTSVTAMIVWNGKSRGSDDVTYHFLTNAKQRKMPLVEILTL